MLDTRTFRMGLDPQDTVAWFNREWEQFATENGAADLPDRVLKRSIWQFVSGATVIQLYQHLFSRVRESRTPVTVPYRCDSPGLKRHMQMTISTEDGANLQLSSTIVRTEPQPHSVLFDLPGSHSDLILGICAWCKKIRLPSGEWHETEEAVKKLCLLEQANPPNLSHTMCEDCMKSYFP